MRILSSCNHVSTTVWFYNLLDENNSRMPRAFLKKKSLQQQLTKRQMHDRLFPISPIIHLRDVRDVGYWWRSINKLMSDVRLLTPAQGQNSIGSDGKRESGESVLSSRFDYVDDIGLKTAVFSKLFSLYSHSKNALKKLPWVLAYDMHSCIIHTPKFRQENSEKNLKRKEKNSSCFDTVIWMHHMVTN